VKIYKFSKFEARGDIYPLCLNLIKRGFEIEAFLLILSIWNFARFRYAIKDFELLKFKNKIKKINPHFYKFKNKNFKDINFDKYKKEIKYIFKILSDIKGIEKTGATKLMHLKNPNVFVMWDGYIRKNYGFKEGNADNYFDFLKKMQELFGSSKVSTKNKTLTKLIDEHNYITITQPALNKNKK
jgi:hypothetical protein